MGRRDNELIFSEGQALTVDAYSTNVLDKGAAGALGAGVELVVRVTNDADFDSSGDTATLQIKLRTSAGLTGSDLNSSAVDLVLSKVITQAEMVKNAEIFRVELPAGLKEYIQVYYDNGTEAFTAGKLDAYLSAGGDKEVRP